MVGNILGGCLFGAQQTSHTHALEASYEISLPIAKHGKNHTTGEQLIKPAISIFLRTVLQKYDEDIWTMPLSNNNDSNKIDDMWQNVRSQLVEKVNCVGFLYKWTNLQSWTVRLYNWLMWGILTTRNYRKRFYFANLLKHPQVQIIFAANSDIIWIQIKELTGKCGRRCTCYNGQEYVLLKNDNRWKPNILRYTPRELGCQQTVPCY